MLWRTSELTGYEIQATDGLIGSVTDLLFDDADWTVRWAVIDTGTWLSGREVLLPPSVLGRPDATMRVLPVDLTRERVKNSPGISKDAPVSRQVSRQMETDLYTYYGWTPYWYPGYAAPIGVSAPLVPPPRTGISPAGSEAPDRPPDRPMGDPHLRSVKEVTGYYVHATDGDIGHIEDFLVEEGGWAVRYLIIDTKNWWPGKMVLISPQWIGDVSWSEQRATVGRTREEVKNSPEYNPSAAIDRTYEERLYGYYGTQPYWYF